MRKKYQIKLKNSVLHLGEKTLIMGILNVTPDSFSDGGRYFCAEKAVDHALKMAESGADIIDIGGESTRPGAEAVPRDEELSRVIPVIEALRKKSGVLISIDTYKSEIAEAALEAGADIINDISGGRFDAGMKNAAAKSGVPVVLMHIKGTPKDMQEDPAYADVVGEIKSSLGVSVNAFVSAGLPRSQIIIDPGIGFGKSTEHNLTIMSRLDELGELGCPILVGVSRKSVIGNVLGLAADGRIFGTAALVAANIMKGAHIVRVHDVAEMRQVADMMDALVFSASQVA